MILFYPMLLVAAGVVLHRAGVYSGGAVGLSGAAAAGAGGVLRQCGGGAVSDDAIVRVCHRLCLGRAASDHHARTLAPKYSATSRRDAAANPSFGYSILIYGLLGSLMQGIRPLFRRGRWELPVLMTGIGTGLLLIIEHLWICFLRGRFFFSEEIWMNIGTTALLSMMVSPLLFLGVHWLSAVAGYQIRYDGLRLRRSW